MSPYEKWSLIIQALTALGTIGAVIVALFLAVRPPKPNFCIDASVRKIVKGEWLGTLSAPELYEPPRGTQALTGILVSAKNIGLHSEGVQHYIYDVSLFSRYLFRWNPGVAHINTRGVTGVDDSKGFHSIIPPGESAKFFMPLSKFDELQLDYFLETLAASKLPKAIKTSKWYAQLAPYTFRCRVELDRNHTAVNRLDKSLQNYITQKYLQQLAA